jgi:hypothetical protein
MKNFSCVAILLLFLNVSSTHSEKAASYLGSKQCETCHSQTNDAWRKTGHAKAFESLKKTKQETLPACLKCHVTAYEQEGGFIDSELTPDMVREAIIWLIRLPP